MRKCPCCGKFAELSAQSVKRPGVTICDNCLESDEVGVERQYNDYRTGTHMEWSIDDSKAPQATKDYFRLQDRYFTARECSDDKSEIAKLERQYVSAKENRTPKFLVYVEDVDGVSPIAEFVDQNLALARVLGWLGEGATPYGKNSWVGTYGSVISIAEM